MMDAYEELQELLDSYDDEVTASWKYTRAFLSFRREGNTAASRKLLKKAIECNRHVPDYLMEKKELPEMLPDGYSFGDEREAIEYAAGALIPWALMPGALDWLKRAVK
jgi:hypothetical protein